MDASKRWLSRLLSVIVFACALAAGHDACASTRWGQQLSDMRSYQQLAWLYRHQHGRFPESDDASTWFEKLKEDDLHLPESFGLTPGGTLPLDVNGFPYVYELPTNPADEMVIIRSVGANGIDDKGALDDWDIRYGPNLGYWYKRAWPALYRRAAVCAITALVLLILIIYFVRPWLLALATALAVVGILGAFVLPFGFGSGPWRRPGSYGPDWFYTVTENSLMIAQISVLLFAIVGLQYFRTKRLRRHGLCSQCGYDLRGTVAAGRWECPECGARIEKGSDSADVGGL